MPAVHYVAPVGFEARFNRVVRWLSDHGVSLAGAHTLEVAGRTSGQLQRVPVNPMRYEGAEYLVSPRGRTQWVRNLRVAGSAHLVSGSRRREVRAAEVDDAAKVAFLREYLRKWGWEVGRFLPADVTAKSTDAELAAIAPLVPVFEIHS